MATIESLSRNTSGLSLIVMNVFFARSTGEILELKKLNEVLDKRETPDNRIVIGGSHFDLLCSDELRGLASEDYVPFSFDDSDGCYNQE